MRSFATLRTATIHPITTAHMTPFAWWNWCMLRDHPLQIADRDQLFPILANRHCGQYRQLPWSADLTHVSPPYTAHASNLIQNVSSAFAHISGICNTRHMPYSRLSYLLTAFQYHSKLDTIFSVSSRTAILAWSPRPRILSTIPTFPYFFTASEWPWRWWRCVHFWR